MRCSTTHISLALTTTKARSGGRWTEARFRQFVISALRAAFRRWPPKFDVLKAAFTCVKRNPATGRQAKHYRCAECGCDFPLTQVQVDHKKPVVDPAVGFTTWDTFVKRLYIEARGLQVLCKPCHKKKTDDERKRRGR